MTKRDTRDDNEPMLVMRDRTKGYMMDNVMVVSTKAGWLMENYRKVELQDLIAKGETVDDYTLGEMAAIADGLVD